ncbi:uncharacterized protein LOC141646545 [Silene latifolia]|uniref:uncharacterized protein LOC141646545 n=1 Tax=Silene latifolia TaxID=37657 RepID=UPI003D772467
MEDELEICCTKIKRKNFGHLAMYKWMEYFVGKGGELEHVACLAMWLSRYVFCTDCLNINTNIFALAIRLAKGTTIALGCGVLAEIYRDLSLLKRRIVAEIYRDLPLDLWSLLQLVQVWGWERFLTVSPKPLCLVPGEPRIARWHNVHVLKHNVCSSRMDEGFAEELFLWRPYGLYLQNWDFPKFYGDEENWVEMNSEVDEEYLSFAKCLRDCMLEGVDCVERYLPYRVGMQFGFDQDVPDSVPRKNSDLKLAGGSMCYVPPRLLEGDITVRYLNWWKGASLISCPRKLNIQFKGIRPRDFPSPRCNDAMQVDSVSSKEILMTELVPVENLASQSHECLVPEIGKISERAPVAYETDKFVELVKRVCTPSEHEHEDANQTHEARDDVTMVDIEETSNDENDNPLESLYKEFEERISLLEITVSTLMAQLNPSPKVCKLETHFFPTAASPNHQPKVYFRGTPSPLQCWESWVERLESKHEPAWRKAGIFDAIKGSTYQIEKQIDLLLCLAEKWCPESNTFVFPWGEVSITVEDVMVLGGFSPLGDSVMSSSSSVVDDVEERLINWRSEVGVGSSSKSGVIKGTWTQWTESFMGRGDELEHAAFLALWLSRHVFITKCSQVIRPCVFSMAARLSRGVKIALAPAVLAIIYRELRWLKEKLVHCLDYPYDVDALELVAPFHLVQLWAWERFPRLAPVPRMLNLGEPILARWEGVRIQYMGLKTELDSTGETFRWRPYATSIDNWSFPCFYDDVGKWVSIDSDEKWEMFAVCLRVCQLQGFDVEDAENYNPHRVAKQFGFDQDIPCSFPRSSNEALEITSPDLDQLVTMTKLYVPSRLFQGGVTLRYADWWKGKSLLGKNDPLRVYRKRKLSSITSSLPMLCPKICDRSNELDAMDVAGNASENQMEKSPPKEEESSRNVLQVCSQNTMTCAFHMKVCIGKCSNNPDHNSSHNEADEINILCSKLAETELNTPCDEAAGSDFAAKHQNLANGGSKNSEVNARDQNREHNVVKQHEKTEVKTSGALLAEDEPDEALVTTNQADIPAGGQLAVSNNNPFVALCVQYELRISRLEREFSALLPKKY